jgi:hypothetical protein
MMIKSRIMKWPGHIACMGYVCIWILFGKSEGRRPLGRPGNKWEDNIKMNVR